MLVDTPHPNGSHEEQSREGSVTWGKVVPTASPWRLSKSGKSRRGKVWEENIGQYLTDAIADNTGILYIFKQDRGQEKFDPPTSISGMHMGSCRE